MPRLAGSLLSCLAGRVDLPGGRVQPDPLFTCASLFRDELPGHYLPY
jgi:hypothetical protein